MSSFTGNSIIAKAKSIYGNRLKKVDYEYMVSLKSVSEVEAYLRMKPYYKDLLKELNSSHIHRGQLEEIIRKVIFSHSLKLVHFIKTTDFPFYTLNMVQREIDIILSVIRAIISGEFDSMIAMYPAYFKKHASFDLEKITVSKSFGDLLSALENTRYYKVLKPYNVLEVELIKYVAIEQALEKLFYEVVFQRIEDNYTGKQRKELESIYATKIEVGNIVKIYRLKKFYKADRETILESLILNHTRISTKKLEEIIAVEDPDLILHFLERSEFARFKDEDEYIYVEYFAEQMKYGLAKRFMYFSNNAPKVYSAFTILLEIERDNLFNIIEGIRYDLSEEEIKRMLIY